MHAITISQVEGFPSPNEVRTLYVEHDSSDADTTNLQWVPADKRIQITEKESIETLASVGFLDKRQAQAIGSLSGGWKMKLAQCYSKLVSSRWMDRPTNYLDVINVAGFNLTGLKTRTSNIVLHDSGFLNNTITRQIFPDASVWTEGISEGIVVIM